MFEHFLGSSRKDTDPIVGASYQQRMTLIRKYLAEQDTHAKGVMMRGILSDAPFQSMENEPIQPCVWCHTNEAPLWQHLAWQNFFGLAFWAA